MAESPVLVERFEAVGVVTLNRPGSLNALNNDLLGALADALSTLDDDETVHVVVVSGGSKVFAAGADLKQLDRELAAPAGASAFLESRFGYWDRIRATRCPLLAAVSGYALGAGCELALTCDLVVAAESARFGLPEVGLGLIPGAGGTQRLGRLVGKAKAMELVLTGRMLTAYESERLGIVNRVVPAELLRDEAFGLAREIASKAPIAVRLAKRAVLTALETPLEVGLEFERRSLAEALATEDAREGIRAFLEKRPAVFHGR